MASLLRVKTPLKRQQGKVLVLDSSRLKNREAVVYSIPSQKQEPQLMLLRSFSRDQVNRPRAVFSLTQILLLHQVRATTIQR